MSINKIVIPAAGLGTRFLPFTKTIPKELLPLINKPALQQVVEEGVASGVDNFYLIISNQKPEIKDYFTPDTQLAQTLKAAGKEKLLASYDAIINKAKFNYIIQEEMLGLGHAILMAKDAVGDDTFGVILPDDIILGADPGMQQLIDVAKKHDAIVIAVMEVQGDEISAYGCIKPGNAITDDIIEIQDIIEKPKASEAFSNLGIIGRYVFTPAIFDAIEAVAPQANGEIQLTDAITHLIKQGHKVLAYKIKGKRFDLGRPPGWLAANMYLALQSPEYRDAVKYLL